MDLDIDKTFGELYRSEDVVKILKQLQRCLKTRDEAWHWARHLRFLTPLVDHSLSPVDSHPDEDHTSAPTSDVCVCAGRHIGFHNSTSQDVLEVTAASEFPDCRHYVAVSWTWPSDQDVHAAVGAPTGYVVETSEGPRRCKVPRNILSRAISYAAHYGLSFVWFDRECIIQEDHSEQWLGIQSMDMVYQRSSHPLGILQTCISTQAQIDLLAKLVEGVDFPAQDLPALLDLLQLLEQDKFFTRSWILQESTSAGLEMSLLIPHDPALSKSEVLGTIDGEIEISIFEYMTAMSWAHACVSLCGDVMDPQLQARLFDIIDRLSSYVPLSIEDHEGEFIESDYRQVCNAAQALTYLKPRMNTHVSDRLAIMGNMCNYALRFDTNEIVSSSGYGFSICAFALSIFNGDMSLTRSTNAVYGESLAYSWGPQQNLSLSKLSFVEEDSELVRVSPAKLCEKGLLLRGWLWRVDSSLAIDSSNFSPAQGKDGLDPAALIWGALKQLMRERLFHAAQVLWHFTSTTELGDGRKGDWAKIPAKLEDIFNLETAKFVYCDDGRWVRSEADFRLFFEQSGKETLGQETRDDREVARRWKFNQWLWSMILQGRLPLGQRASSTRDVILSWDSNPSAIFDVQETLCGSTQYVFQPSTILDAQLARNGRRNDAIFWVVEIEDKDRDSETGCMVIRSTGQMCRGCFQVAEAETPEMFIFS